ncbi:DUF6249 domain-containing protein [Phenylobacterium sp.]|uniref:DUF6249 domain-containing protein n=1 Tax=Phenylobacterium sp. TaxID=1871053 RepID=UPI00286CB67D|nr:DUF6249 domain-containing protein [Phenylobacterium sp.]
MEGTIAVLIPFGFMAMIAAIVIVPRYFRSMERQKMAETLRAAIEKGQPMPTEVIDAMSSNVRTPAAPPSPSRDLRTGLVWMGVAVGLAAMGLALSFEDPDTLYPMIGIAAFPGFIGVAFIIMWAIARERK